MALNIKVVTAELAPDSGTTTQDITISGFGTPDAVMLFTVGDVATSGHYRGNIGFWDGTTQFVVFSGLKEANSSIQGGGGIISDTIYYSKYDSTVRTSAYISETITDGIRLTFSKEPGVDHEAYVTFIFFKGVNAKAGYISGASSTDGTGDVTGLGFTPRLIFGTTHRLGYDGTTSIGSLPFGVAFDNGSSIEQLQAIHTARTSSPIETGGFVGSSLGTAAVVTQSGVNPGYFDVTDMYNDGFEVTSRIAALDTYRFYYMAFDMPGVDIKLAEASAPTSAGNWDPVTTSFTPQFLFMYSHGSASSDSWVNSANDEGLTLYASDGTTQAGHSAFVPNGSTTTPIGLSFYSSTEGVIRDYQGTDKMSFGSPTFDATGVVFSDANVDHGSLAYKFLTLMIGGSGASGPSITSVNGGNSISPGGTYTLTGTNLTGINSVTIEGNTCSVGTVTSTSVQFTMPAHNSITFKYRTQRTLEISNGTDSTSVEVTVIPPTGYKYVNVSALDSDSSLRITADPAFEIGDQVEYGNVVAESGTTIDIDDLDVFGDVSFEIHEDAISFDARAHDGTGWGDWGTQTLQEVATQDLPPVVTISTPDGTYNQGDAVALSATATDAVDGDLTASISWSSNLDGSLGTGGTVNTSALSVGTHIITASATDSQTQTGTDTVTIIVLATGTVSVVKNGLTFSINEETGEYTLSGTNWTSDFETFTVRATYNGVNIDKVYTIYKAKAGSGDSTPNIDIRADATIFKYDSNDEIVSPTLIEFTAIQTNSSATVYWTTEYWNGSAWVETSSNYLNPTSGTTTELSESAFALINQDLIRVVATITVSSVEYTDYVTISKVKDGTEGSTSVTEYEADKHFLTSNFSFEDTSGWSYSTGWSRFYANVSPYDAKSGEYVARYVGSASNAGYRQLINDSQFDVVAGQQLYISVDALRRSLTTVDSGGGGILFRIRWLDRTGSVVTTTVLEALDQTELNALTADTWYNYNYTTTAPSNIDIVKGQFTVVADQISGGNIWVDNCIVERIPAGITSGSSMQICHRTHAAEDTHYGATWTTFDFDTQDTDFPLPTGLTYSSGVFTVGSALNGKTVIITYSVGGYNEETGGRVALKSELQLDTGSGYSAIAEASGYISRDSNRDRGNVVCPDKPIIVSTGDDFRVQVWDAVDTDPPGFTYIQELCWITIKVL